MATTKHQVKIPFVSQKVEDLIMWRDPKKTGVFVGTATMVFLFFYFLKMPLVSLVLYSAGTFVLLVTVWSRFGQSVGKPMPDLPAPLRDGALSETDFRAYADRMKPHVDKALGISNEVITCRDLTKNVKMCLGFFVAGKLLAYMSPISIAFLFVVIAFSVPKIYETHKDKIDEHVIKARDHGYKGLDIAKGHVNNVISQSPMLQKVRDRYTSSATSASTSATSTKKVA